MDLASPFETSFGCSRTRDCVLIKGFGEGLIGYGECPADKEPGYSYETSRTAWHILVDFLIPSVIKKEISSISELHSRLNFVKGHPMAKAGLEMMYWDLLGKMENKSLKELLGGVREKVPVGVSVGIQETIPQLVDAVSIYLSQGYNRVKIKIKPGRDIQETTELRKNFPEINLQVDANSAYTLEMADVLLPLDELNLLLIEQPLAEDDLWDHHKLQKQFTTPICLDESILSLRHAQQAIDMKACKIINIKPGRVGGISEALAIHDFCFSMQVPVWCGGMLETGVGRATNLALSSLPGYILPADISATDRYYNEDITHQNFRLNHDSTIDVPKGPGLGIDINSDVLKEVTLDTVSITD